MRSSIHGTFATLLLLIPVGAIPALAIFGIPQFAPVVASPLREGPEGDRERRVGESARAPADDLFQDDIEFPAQDEAASPVPGRLGDSVPVPNRNVARNPSSRDRNVGDKSAELPGRLPSWAEDSEVDEPRDSHPRRDDNESVNPKAPQGYQRQRDVPLERAIPSPREDTVRDSLTWEGVRRRLNDLEIRNFRLEPSRQANQFVFICSYTPTDSPRVSYRFEAESEEPLKAVEKVLAQIDEWQQQRR
jgi:hypothetical protein